MWPRRTRSRARRTGATHTRSMKTHRRSAANDGRAFHQAGVWRVYTTKGQASREGTTASPVTPQVAPPRASRGTLRTFSSTLSVADVLQPGRHVGKDTSTCVLRSHIFAVRSPCSYRHLVHDRRTGSCRRIQDPPEDHSNSALPRRQEESVIVSNRKMFNPAGIQASEPEEVSRDETPPPARNGWRAYSSPYFRTAYQR